MTRATNFPTEAKVKAAATAATVTGAVVTLAMYLLGQVDAIAAMPETAAGALLVLVTAAVTGAATFAAGWYAKHTSRPNVDAEETTP